MRAQKRKRSVTQAPESTGFKFVSIERPDDVTNPDYRRQIRSHVTRIQHQRQRERGTKTQRSPPTADVQRPSEISSPVIALNSPVVATKSGSSIETESETEPEHKDVERADLLQEADHGESEPDEDYSEDDSTCEEIVASEYTLGVLNSRSENMFSRGAMAYRTFALDDTTNTVGLNLEALSLNAASLMSYYKFMVDTQTKTVGRSPAQQRGRPERYYKFVHSDPVLLTTAILIATRIQVEARGLQFTGSESVPVLKIRAFLVQSINAALNDPRRAISDQLLMAVGLSASHEAKSGNLREYDMHMRGLVQMVKLRGGFPLAGEAYPGIEQVLIWLDKNASNVAGCECYFKDMVEPPNLIKPKVDEELFRMKRP